MSAVVKQDRQRAIRELVARTPIASQDELVLALAARGFEVTQATVSRDIAELGLVKVGRGDRHVYIAPEDLAPAASATPAAVPANGSSPATSPAALPANGLSPADDRLRRILSDVPVRVRRSGLILLLVGTPGTASVIAQAIDDSTLDEQEGTLAGDDTLLVLFATEARLERWRERFTRIAGQVESGADTVGAPLPAPTGAPTPGPLVTPAAASSRASIGTASQPAASRPPSMPDPSPASADADAIPYPIVSEASR
jgi:transcriptional regulator of arginine metabolism